MVQEEGASVMTTKPPELDKTEIEKRSEETLKRLLAMPPQPKTKTSDNANPPKKRGRPKKEKDDDSAN